MRLTIGKKLTSSFLLLALLDAETALIGPAELLRVDVVQIDVSKSVLDRNTPFFTHRASFLQQITVAENQVADAISDLEETLEVADCERRVVQDATF